MAREFFKNLPDTTTPLNAQRMNGFLNGEEAMGSIVVEDVTCKNIFDGKLELGAINNNGINFGDVEAVRSVNFINVTPNTTYTQSSVDDYKTIIFFYDSSKTFISKIGNNLSTNTFTTPSNCVYAKICTYASEGVTDTNSKFQIELGEVATNYVEHKEFKPTQTSISPSAILKSEAFSLNTINLNDISLINDNLVVFNLTVNTLQSIPAKTYVNVANISNLPITPRKNVIFNVIDTTNMIIGFGYYQSSSGNIRIKFASSVTANDEISINSAYTKTTH